MLFANCLLPVTLPRPALLISVQPQSGMTNTMPGAFRFLELPKELKAETARHLDLRDLKNLSLSSTATRTHIVRVRD